MSKFFFYDNKFIDWTIKILFSINLILPGINEDILGYPLNVLILTLISFWLYIYRVKVFAIVFLLMATLINYLHLGVTSL